MKRYTLEPAVYPLSDPPHRLRASTLGKSMWCDETVRLDVLGYTPEFEGNEATETGTIMHNVLEESQGRRFPWEIDFLKGLRQFQDEELGFVRKIAMTKIYYNLTGHQDDIQVTKGGEVSLIEYKTTQNPNFWFVKNWLRPMAEFQTKIYAWIMEPLIAELGGVISRTHAVLFYDSKTFEHKFTFDVIYQPFQLEQSLLRVVEMIEGTQRPIHPKPWKCRNCRPQYKTNPNHYIWEGKTGCEVCDARGENVQEL